MGHYNDVMDVHTAPGTHDLSLSDIDAQDLVSRLSVARKYSTVVWVDEYLSLFSRIKSEAIIY